MLEYFIQEGIEGSANLKEIYKSLNNEYFGGSLPNIKVEWSGKLKRAVGQAHVSYIGKRIAKDSFNQYLKEIPVADVELNMNSLKIKLSKSVDMTLPDVKAVMLHEMVHILLYTKKKFGGHHGTPEFDGWIKKLSGLSGLAIPLKESSFKKSPKLQAKEGYILLIWENSGRIGASSYSKNSVTKTDEMVKKLGMHMKHTNKVKRIEMYRINHPIVSSMGSKRTFKGLSWQYIDEETAKEIMKKGKIFFYADKVGGWIKPKIAGIPKDEKMWVNEAKEMK
jgi:predicted SprT family Zn-dependent metalloprotease